MKISEMAENLLFIDMAKHGVPGAAVKVSRSDLTDTINEIKRSMDEMDMPVENLQEIHAHLAMELSNMLLKIAKDGYAVDSQGERYDRQTFDNDLVLCAVYDHVANNTPIAVKPMNESRRIRR